MIIANTIKLMVASWEFLQSNKKVLLFPLLSLLTCALLTFVIFYVVRNNPTMFNSTRSAVPVSALNTVSVYIALLLWYFICAFIVIFFNVATLNYVYSCIRGASGSLGEALCLSLSRIKVIFVWSLISSTIGLPLNLMEKNSNNLSRFIGNIIGVAWHLVSYLVIPFFVVEDIGPITAFKKSIELLRKTAKDQLIADFNVGLVFFIINIPVICLLILLQHTHNIHLNMVIVVFVATFVTISWIFYMAVNNIFRINYFLYLNNAPMSDVIQPSLMEQLVKPAPFRKLCSKSP